ncbi:oligosaccharide flippase family protein, partial [Acinetobacter baumannii]
MNIKKKSLLASLWSFLDILLNKASYFIATLILARIIGPKDFGLIGIIAVFLGIGMTFVDSGLSTSLLRAKDV